MKKITLFLLAAIALSSCARQGTITGGAKDTTPPEMDTLRSSPNYVTRFDERKITLQFNEWVVLSEASKEVVISPPLEKNPTISLKKKAVVVDFGETPNLRPNTTYTINFGTAVRDLHEKNPAKDLRYVFSTGDAIDSLLVEGVVVDALTGNPVENITMMLYEDTGNDSVILKEKPYYFSRTDKSGAFSIKNVKPGTFIAVAIEEGQLPNLKWNGNSERIGFQEAPVILSDSVQRAVVRLAIFNNAGKPRLNKDPFPAYGLLKLNWTPAPDTAWAEHLETPEGFRFLLETTPDTSYFWYDFPSDTAVAPWSLVANTRQGSDTLKIKAASRSDFNPRFRIRFSDAAPPSKGSSGRSGPGRVKPVPSAIQIPSKIVSVAAALPVILRFNAPVASFDTSFWEVIVDSIPLRDFGLANDTASIRNLKMTAAWKPGSSLRLRLLPGAITSFYNIANADTLQYQYNFLGEKQLGVLNLTVENTVPGIAYILELLNGTASMATRKFVAEAVSQKFQFPDLPPNAYTAKLVIDDNQNGRWDTGDYFTKKQPEEIITKKLESLRANWELEATISTVKEDSKKRQ